MRALAVRLRFLFAAALLVVATAGSLSAQTMARVKADHVSVWNTGFSTIATTVNIGTTLEVVAQQGNWYEVVLPGPEWQVRTTGYIAKSRVELLGTATVPQSQPTRQGRSQPGRSRSSTPAAPAGKSSVRVFGEAGYGRFTAKDTFDAVLGSPYGLWYGGGVLFQRGSGLFAQASAEHFGDTGERVFVNNGTVFSLGLSDTISITPVMGVVGMRKASGRRGAAVYVGAGAGVYLLRETSEFADAADNVKRSNAAYRGIIGFELPLAKAVAAALEFDYTAVPNALTGGLSDVLAEHDLGSAQVKVKLLFGKH